MRLAGSRTLSIAPCHRHIERVPVVSRHHLDRLTAHGAVFNVGLDASAGFVDPECQRFAAVGALHFDVHAVSCSAYRGGVSVLREGLKKGVATTFAGT